MLVMFCWGIIGGGAPGGGNLGGIIPPGGPPGGPPGNPGIPGGIPNPPGGAKSIRKQNIAHIMLLCT